MEPTFPSHINRVALRVIAIACPTISDGFLQRKDGPWKVKLYVELARPIFIGKICDEVAVDETRRDKYGVIPLLVD